jgi:hypothetical protein
LASGALNPLRTLSNNEEEKSEKNGMKSRRGGIRRGSYRRRGRRESTMKERRQDKCHVLSHMFPSDITS